MVCATEVYQWFKELLPFNRIDFLCSLMQLCLPSELRFIGTLLDDMNNKDYANLREAEERSNSPNEFRQYPVQPFSGECVRKLCLCLSLLKSTNQKVGQQIYEILQIHSDFAIEHIRSKNDFSHEILLLYALASYHPAFTFENRYKIGKNFKNMLAHFDEPSDCSINKNNSCCYDVSNSSELKKFNISVKKVKMESQDARILLELVTDDRYPSFKMTKFSDIRKILKYNLEYKSKNISKLNIEINNLTRNGNFTSKNIETVLKMILKLIDDEDYEDIADKLKEYFINLPPLIEDMDSYFYDNDSEANAEIINHDNENKRHNNNKCNFPEKHVDKKRENPKPDATKRSQIVDNSVVSDTHKSAVVSVDKVLKDQLGCDSVIGNASNQHSSEIITSSQEESNDNAVADCCDRMPISENNVPYQDLNQTVPIFQYCLPHYSLVSNAKSTSSIPQYHMYSNNSLDHSSSATQTNNSVMRPLDTLILTHCPQRFLQFNTHFPPLVLCPVPVNTVNFLPPNDMNELFLSHRYPPTGTAATANLSPSPSLSSVVNNNNKLSSSSTPPRLQSNNQKSSSHSSNFHNGTGC